MGRKLSVIKIVLTGCVFFFAPSLRAEQLPNLTDAAPAARFTLTGKDWPASPGGASICLWEDDKLAALSITVDDNSAMNIDWWLDKADTYGFKMTWFVISGYVGDSNPAMHGTWPVYSNVLARGHEVQSHSVTHDNGDAEYRDSQIAIETNLPGNSCDFIAYPGGSAHGPDPVAAAPYYASARGTTGLINTANKIPYMNVCATSSPNLTNAAAGWCYLPNLFTTNDMRYYRGWSVQIFHSVYDYSQYAQPLLDFVDAHRAELWCGPYGAVAKYGEERDTATLTVTTNTANLIKMTLTDRMMDTIFNYPLTVKVRLPDTWAAVTATQNGSPIESTVIQKDGVNYALVKAVPDQGEIALSPDATANFSVSPSSGLLPLTVTFADISTITGITSRFWSFGDGAFANTTATNITHTYTAAGTYTVAMIVGSPAGVSTNTQIAAVIVTAPVPPTAAFSANVISGNAPLEVTFTDSSTGSITNRLWDFGDGNTTNTLSTSISHTYAVTGTYTVALTVSGSAGTDTNTQAGLITVIPFPPPAAAFSANVTSGNAPLAVTFTDSSTGSITNRLWDFGDGTTTNTLSTSVAHTYAAGTYTVSLTASGPEGSDTDTQTNLINATEPPAQTILTFNPDVYDTTVNSLGTIAWNGGTAPRVGTDGGVGTKTSYIMPFLMTALPDGQSITDVSLSFYCASRSNLDSTTETYPNLDVLGIRISASPTVIASDISGTVIADSVMSLNGVSIGAHNVSSAGMASWLAANWTPGQYVFLSLAIDAPALNSRFITVNSANAAANKPVLSVTVAPVSGPTQPPPPPSVSAGGEGMFGSGQDVITWTTVQGSGYVYSVWYSTNLLDGFQPLETNLADSVTSITNVIDATPVFYKVLAQ